MKTTLQELEKLRDSTSLDRQVHLDAGHLSVASLKDGVILALDHAITLIKIDRKYKTYSY